MAKLSMLRGRSITRAGLLAVLLCCVMVCSARAAQKQIGLSCSSDNSAIDWDTVAQCNGTTYVRGPLILGAMTNPPYSATTCTGTNAGMIQWTGSLFQACNGSSWQNLVLGGTALSALTAATTTNSIDSGNYAQTWKWGTLAGASALTLSTSSTTAASNAQTMLNVSMLGLNTTTTQTTYGVQISNSHTGTASTNVGLYATATGGTNNYAAIFDQGYVGIGTTTPGTALEVNGQIKSSGSSASYLVIRRDTNATVWQLYSSAGNFSVWDNIGGTDRFRRHWTICPKLHAYGACKHHRLWVRFWKRVLKGESRDLPCGVNPRAQTGVFESP